MVPLEPTMTETNEPQALRLPSKQKKFLRGIAHELDAIVQVGQAGVTPEVIGAVNLALSQHELIKIRLREPENKKTMAEEMSAGSSSCLCGLVGHTVILYRPHPDDPKIELPD